MFINISTHVYILSVLLLICEANCIFSTMIYTKNQEDEAAHCCG